MFFTKDGKDDAKKKAEKDVKAAIKSWNNMVVDYYGYIRDGKYEDAMRKAFEMKTAAEILIMSTTTIIKLKYMFDKAMSSTEIDFGIKEEYIDKENIDNRGTDEIGKP